MNDGGTKDFILSIAKSESSLFTEVVYDYASFYN